MSKKTTINTIFVNTFGEVAEFLLTVDNLRDAARLYTEQKMFADDNIVIDIRRIHLSDIIELCLPCKKKLAKITVDDLFDTQIDGVAA